MEYLVRNCKVEDLPSIVILCQHHAAYEESPFVIDAKLNMLKEAIFYNNKLNCLVVECDNKIVGYATYTYDFSTWEAKSFMHLDCLYLEPEYRNFGIGQALIEKLKNIALMNDCMIMQWQTPLFNHRAIKFYARIGGVAKEKIRFTMDLL